MITYDYKYSIGGSLRRVNVYLDGKKVGTIRRTSDNCWRYETPGAVGAAFATIALVKKSIEAPAELRDLDGYLYEVDAATAFAYRITQCCRAAVTVDLDTGETYCKGCHKNVDVRLGLSPNLPKDGN